MECNCAAIRTGQAHSKSCPLFEYTCPQCARIEDVEGLAKVLCENMNPGIAWRVISGRGMWESQARAVSAWLKEVPK